MSMSTAQPKSLFAYLKWAIISTFIGLALGALGAVLPLLPTVSGVPG